MMIDTALRHDIASAKKLLIAPNSMMMPIHFTPMFSLSVERGESSWSSVGVLLARAWVST